MVSVDYDEAFVLNYTVLLETDGQVKSTTQERLRRPAAPLAQARPPAPPPAPAPADQERMCADTEAARAADWLASDPHTAASTSHMYNVAPLGASIMAAEAKSKAERQRQPSLAAKKKTDEAAAANKRAGEAAAAKKRAGEVAAAKKRADKAAAAKKRAGEAAAAKKQADEAKARKAREKAERESVEWLENMVREREKAKGGGGGASGGDGGATPLVFARSTAPGCVAKAAMLRASKQAAQQRPKHTGRGQTQSRSSSANSTRTSTNELYNAAPLGAAMSEASRKAWEAALSNEAAVVKEMGGFSPYTAHWGVIHDSTST